MQQQLVTSQCGHCVVIFPPCSKPATKQNQLHLRLYLLLPVYAWMYLYLAFKMVFFVFFEERTALLREGHQKGHSGHSEHSEGVIKGLNQGAMPEAPNALAPFGQ